MLQVTTAQRAQQIKPLALQASLPVMRVRLPAMSVHKVIIAQKIQQSQSSAPLDIYVQPVQVSARLYHVVLESLTTWRQDISQQIVWIVHQGIYRIYTNCVIYNLH